jgi:Fe-S cluster assembly ATPase SufC
MSEGKVIKIGDTSILKDIEKYGYSKYEVKKEIKNNSCLKKE